MKKLILAALLAVGLLAGSATVAVTTTTAQAPQHVAGATAIYGCGAYEWITPAKTFFGVVGTFQCLQPNAGNNNLYANCVQIDSIYGWINDGAASGSGQACDNADNSTQLNGVGTCASGNWQYRLASIWSVNGTGYWTNVPGTEAWIRC